MTARLRLNRRFESVPKVMIVRVVSRLCGSKWDTEARKRQKSDVVEENSASTRLAHMLAEPENFGLVCLHRRIIRVLDLREVPL